MTLIEVVLVVALLSVLTGLALATTQPVAQRYRLRDTVELAAQLVTQAQALARASSRCHRVALRAGGALAAPGADGDELVLEARPDANCEAAPGTVAWRLVERERLPSGIVGRNVVDANFQLVELRPNGRVRVVGAVDHGALRFEAGGLGTLLQVSPLGVTCADDVAAHGACP